MNSGNSTWKAEPRGSARHIPTRIKHSVIVPSNKALVEHDKFAVVPGSVSNKSLFPMSSTISAFCLKISFASPRQSPAVAYPNLPAEHTKCSSRQAWVRRHTQDLPPVVRSAGRQQIAPLKELGISPSRAAKKARYWPIHSAGLLRVQESREEEVGVAPIMAMREPVAGTGRMRPKVGRHTCGGIYVGFSYIHTYVCNRGCACEAPSLLSPQLGHCICPRQPPPVPSRPLLRSKPVSGLQSGREDRSAGNPLLL